MSVSHDAAASHQPTAMHDLGKRGSVRPIWHSVYLIRLVRVSCRL